MMHSKADRRLFRALARSLIYAALFSAGFVSTFAIAQESSTDLVELYAAQYSSLPDTKIDHMNRYALSLLREQPAERVLPNGRYGFLTEDEAQSLAKWLYDHPIVGAPGLDKYDPDGRIGFCFGRAMAVHLELLSRGFSKDAIRKIFITPASGLHHFHVVTAARGADGVWWAFDLTGQAEKLDDWYATWRERAGTKMMVHVTEAEKFAGQAARYNRFQFADGRGIDFFYNNYFLDLLKNFRETALTTKRLEGQPKSCRAIFSQ